MKKWAVVLIVLFVSSAKSDVGSSPPVLPLEEITKCLPSHSLCKEMERHTHDCWHLISGADTGKWYTFWSIWWYAEMVTNKTQREDTRRYNLQRLIDLVGWRMVLTGELPSFIEEVK